jgi:hypothetical protein
MHPDCSATDHNSWNCPHCGGRQIYLTYSSTTVIIEPEYFTFSYQETSFTPGHGYWPHHFHEKVVRERIKPQNQSTQLPEVTRKQFMQLKTFQNLRFH